MAIESIERLSAATRAVLEHAGWYAGRDVVDSVREWKRELCDEGKYRWIPTAALALGQFGGLLVEQRGAGVECARATFVLEPTLWTGGEQTLADYSGQVGSYLFPLGEAFGGHALLAIAENGRVYTALNEIELIGDDIYEAVEALVSGRLPRPINRNHP